MIKAMLAKVGTEADLDRKGWLYEQKLDGVRCVAILDGMTTLQARSGAIITQRFPELAELHKQANKRCVLDGEIVGTNFNAIQHRIHLQNELQIKIARSQYPAIYYVFDILYLDGESVKVKPLIERKAILSSNFIPDLTARLLDWHIDGGSGLFDQTKQQSLEGIMAKAIYSSYQEDKRSDSWLKIKNFKEATYYICGVTEGENDRVSTFGSLILADKVNGKLTYVGNVGSGFNHQQLNLMLSLLEIYKGGCPFATRPDTDRPVKFWTRPDLKCEVRYLELSNNGMLRFPTFRKVERS
jgi:bifunctional non-homologous end joining protein LigD